MVGRESVSSLPASAKLWNESVLLARSSHRTLMHWERHWERHWTRFDTTIRSISQILHRPENDTGHASMLRSDRFLTQISSVTMQAASVCAPLVEALSAGKAVGFLVGAGISVASGIPDFRSPGGLYKTLKTERLSCSIQHQSWLRQSPSMCVSWNIFETNQMVYHEVRTRK